MGTDLIVTATVASVHTVHNADNGFTSGLLHHILGQDYLRAIPVCDH